MAILASLLLSLPAEAQRIETRKDSTEMQYVYYPVGISKLDPNFQGNSRTLNDIVNTLLQLQYDRSRQIDSISVHIAGLASIEGPAALNERLADQRAAALRDYLVDKTGLTPNYFFIQKAKRNWNEFRKVVTEKRFEGYEEVLSIIDNETDDDTRYRLIRNLRGGSVFRYLQQEVLPSQRNASVVTIYIYKVEIPEEKEPVQETEPYTPPQIVEVTIPAEPEPVKEVEDDEIQPWIAIKTNMLFDAVLCPNLEVEVPIGWSRWSVMAEWWTPWYRWRGNGRHNRSYELLTLGAEVRYWLSKRKTETPRLLRGHFVGAYAAGGKYDIQKGGDANHEGWQGEFTSLGLTYGYSSYIGKHWRLEFSVSAGYVGGPKRKYHGMFDDGHLIWQHSNRLHYVGPTKAKVSIAYLIGKRVQKKGGQL